MSTEFRSGTLQSHVLPIAIELCTHENDKSELPTVPSLVAKQYNHPDKDTIPYFPDIHINNAYFSKRLKVKNILKGWVQNSKYYGVARAS